MRNALALAATCLVLVLFVGFSAVVEQVSRPSEATRSTELVVLSNRRDRWVDAGSRADVGILIAVDGELGVSTFDSFVQYVESSTSRAFVVTSISDKAFDSLRKMPELRALVVIEGSVTNACLDRLREFPCLETVGFYYCDVTHEAIAHIQSRMPGTRFEVFEPGVTGFVFDATDCISSAFFTTYRPSRIR